MHSSSAITPLNAATPDGPSHGRAMVDQLRLRRNLIPHRRDSAAAAAGSRLEVRSDKNVDVYAAQQKKQIKSSAIVETALTAGEMDGDPAFHTRTASYESNAVATTRQLTPADMFVHIQLGQDIDGEDHEDLSGWSVAMSSDGMTIAIGAPDNSDNGVNRGHVRVYTYDGIVWVQLGQDIDGEDWRDKSGYSVAISSDGMMVAIGARANDGNGECSGHVRVYEYDGSDWIQVGSDIDGEAAGDKSGHSVAMSSNGMTVAIGAYANDGANGSDSGHVRVYEYDGSAWIQVGSDIDGEAADDFSGWSVAMSSNGMTVAIGANWNDGNGDRTGQVRVYEYDGSAWIQVGSDIDGEAVLDFSGGSVAMSSNGMMVAIGGRANDGNGSNSGHVRVYEYDGSAWIQVGSDIDGEAAGDQSGWSVAMSSDGMTVAIGAHKNDGANGSDSGHVRVYKYDGSSWVQVGLDIDGEGYDDESGYSVAMSSDGTTVAIGAIYNCGDDYNGSGHVRVFQTFEVTSMPSEMPSSGPSSYPTVSSPPTVSETPSTAPSISQSPSESPSIIPSSTPSASPSDVPSTMPSVSLMPSNTPSKSPSDLPSETPSTMPSNSPSSTPSSDPTISRSPSAMPSYRPSKVPSSIPSRSPSARPSVSSAPSAMPSEGPSNSPSNKPTPNPTRPPTRPPTALPSSRPSDIPSAMPSITASSTPSFPPSVLPSNKPSLAPSSPPSIAPTMSHSPSTMPSPAPSTLPSSGPSTTPSSTPSSKPSVMPSSSPTPECQDYDVFDQTMFSFYDFGRFLARVKFLSETLSPADFEERICRIIKRRLRLDVASCCPSAVLNVVNDLEGGRHLQVNTANTTLIDVDFTATIVHAGNACNDTCKVAFADAINSDIFDNINEGTVVNLQELSTKSTKSGTSGGSMKSSKSGNSDGSMKSSKSMKSGSSF